MIAKSQKLQQELTEKVSFYLMLVVSYSSPNKAAWIASSGVKLSTACWGRTRLILTLSLDLCLELNIKPLSKKEIETPHLTLLPNR